MDSVIKQIVEADKRLLSLSVNSRFSTECMMVITPLMSSWADVLTLCHP
ncbi:MULTISPECIES: hypothetical protein [Shewanella]|nr:MULTISPECIES: hypothetical protein [Shewanella]